MSGGIAADTPDLLRRIVEDKAREVAERRARRDLDEVRAAAAGAEPVRGFVVRLRERIDEGRLAVVAEAKRASPSAGLIRGDFDPAAIARSYASAGATCLSVLTDEPWFQGSDAYLREARAACDLPVLRKDFVIDPWQVWETRALGADCLLLIVAALTPERLRMLHATALEAGLDVLVEVHDAEELDAALRLPPSEHVVLGINNRDLRRFETRLEITERLIPRLPRGTPVVTESGIGTPADVRRLAAAGAGAFLVGEAFMRAADPGAALEALFGDRL